MGEYTPLYISLALLIIIGVVLPAIINSVVTNPNPDEINSLSTGMIDLVENGLTFNLGSIIGTFTVNPFNILGSELKAGLTDYITALGYLPLWILIPVIIIITTGFIYSTIKLFPTT